jgi:hypothetical protein
VSGLFVAVALAFTQSTQVACSADPTADAGRGSRAWQKRLSAEDLCCRLIDEAVDAFAADRFTLGSWATLLGEPLAKTPAGRRHVLKLMGQLDGSDPERAVFLFYLLYKIADYSDLSRMLDCAERYVGSDRVVGSPAGALSWLWEDLPVEVRPHIFPGYGPRDHEKALKQMRQWLNSPDMPIRKKTHLEFAADLVAEALIAYRKDAKLVEFVWYRFVKLLRFSDCERIAPLMVAWIAAYEMRQGDPIFPSLVQGLQLYAGPFDVPDEGDLNQQKKAQKEIVSWWATNKGKKPAQWMLDRLARRGYATGKPEDVKATAEALVVALQRGTPAERFAAARILGFVLPDGDGIPADDDSLFALPTAEKREATTGVSEFINQLVLCRAMKFAWLEHDLLSWQPDKARYVLRTAAKPPAAK